MCVASCSRLGGGKRQLQPAGADAFRSAPLPLLRCRCAGSNPHSHPSSNPHPNPNPNPTPTPTPTPNLLQGRSSSSSVSSTPCSPRPRRCTHPNRKPNLSLNAVLTHYLLAILTTTRLYLLPTGARVGLRRPGRGAVGAAGGAPALRRPHLPGAPATRLARRGPLALSDHWAAGRDV
eukprot:scaffold16781_cov51-Phaeocystis_antarctica.AAC.2